jgi:hypothetical protein
MKDEKLYPMYLNYLGEQLNDGKITKGSYALLKISGNKFEEFVSKMQKDELFEGEQIKEFRDKKIEDIFDDLD